MWLVHDALLADATSLVWAAVTAIVTASVAARLVVLARRTRPPVAPALVAQPGAMAAAVIAG